MMQPFLTLLLMDVNVVMTLCLKLNTVQAVLSIKRIHQSLGHHHLNPQPFPLVEIGLGSPKILLTFAQISHFMVTT